MSNAEHIIEDLILGMRDGRAIEDIIKDISVQNNLHAEGVGITEEEAVRIAGHVVYSLYDGRFPIDYLEAGDICIDAFHKNLCVITNIDTSIHVLYENGKTFKFKKYQARMFTKTGRNIYRQVRHLLHQINSKSFCDFDEEVV